MSSCSQVQHFIIQIGNNEDRYQVAAKKLKTVAFTHATCNYSAFMHTNNLLLNCPLVAFQTCKKAAKDNLITFVCIQMH